MRDAFGVHRMNKLHTIDMLRDAWEQIRDPASRVAVLFERPRLFHDALVAAEFPGIGKFPSIIECNHLAILLFEHRLGVKRVDLADATLHVQKNDPLGLRRMMQPAQPLDATAGVRIGSLAYRNLVASEQSISGQGAKSTSRGTK
jgi:hypothetical protein